MPVCCWGPQCQAPGATGSHSCTECKKPYHNLCANVGCPNAERENRRTWCGNCVASTQRAVRQSSRAPADLQSKRRRHEAEAFDGPQQLTAAAAAAAAAASATVAAPTAAATNDLRYTGEGLNRDQISQWLAANIDLPSDSSDDESEASTVGAGPAAKRRRKRGEQIALREGEAKAVVQAAMELCSRTSSARLEEIAAALDQAPVADITTFAEFQYEMMDASYGVIGRHRWGKHQLSLSEAEQQPAYRDAVGALVAALPFGSQRTRQCAIAQLANQLKESYGRRKIAALAQPSLYVVNPASLTKLTSMEASTVTYIAGWLGFVMHRTANREASDRQKLQARLLLGLRREPVVNAAQPLRLLTAGGGQPASQVGSAVTGAVGPPPPPPSLEPTSPPPPPPQAAATAPHPTGIEDSPTGSGAGTGNDSGSESDSGEEVEMDETDTESESDEGVEDSDEEVPPLPAAPPQLVLRPNAGVSRRHVLEFREFSDNAMWDVIPAFEAFVRYVEQCWAQMRYRAHDLDIGRCEMAIAAAPPVVTLFNDVIGLAWTWAGVDAALVTELRHKAVSRYINARIKGKLERERQHYKLNKTTQMATRSAVAGKKR